MPTMMIDMSARIYNPAVKAPRLWALGAWLRSVFQSGGFMFAVWMVAIAGAAQVLNFLVGFLPRDWANIAIVVPSALAVIGIATALFAQRKPLHERYPKLVADAGELEGYAVSPNLPNQNLWAAVQHIRTVDRLREEYDRYYDDDRLSKRDQERLDALEIEIADAKDAAITALSYRKPTKPIYPAG